MTLLSRKADYALLILSHLYHHPTGGNARAIAEACGVDPAEVDTNIVVLAVPDAPALVAAAAEHGVRISALGPRTARMVTHLDVDDAGVEHAAQVLTALLTPA